MKHLLLAISLAFAVGLQAQTVNDTAAVIGTIKRSIPKANPVKPVEVEPYVSKTTQLAESAKTNKGNNAVSKLAEEAEAQAQAAFHRATSAYYDAITRENVSAAATIDSVRGYYAWALNNRKSIIERQQNTGTIIFALVTLLVLAGLVFSAIQFRIALKSFSSREPAPDTTFKASVTGVEVSSSLFGVILLTISLAFFYLYLTNVYPLVSLDQIPSNQPTGM